MLEDKSIHELRGIAQSFGIEDIFAKDKMVLVSEIKVKQAGIAEPKAELPAIIDEVDLAETGLPAEIVEALKDYIAIGLKVRLDESRWYMSCREKTDEGTMHMPLKTIVHCARRLLA